MRPEEELPYGNDENDEVKGWQSWACCRRQAAQHRQAGPAVAGDTKPLGCGHPAAFGTTLGHVRSGEKSGTPAV